MYEYSCSIECGYGGGLLSNAHTQCLCVCVCVFQIKLADFGFARHFTEEGTKKPIDMHSLAGTPVFMVRGRSGGGGGGGGGAE